MKVEFSHHLDEQLVVRIDLVARQQEALTNLAYILDLTRDQAAKRFESNLSPEELAKLQTKPEEQPDVKYLRVEVERGNRFTIEPIVEDDSAP